MSASFLALSWSVSRGRDTYGYNICRLEDTTTGKRYRVMGGGYDMQGSVLGEWLQDVHQDKLLTIKERANATYSGTPLMRVQNDAEDALYGMTYDRRTGVVSVDGACGIDSVKRIASACGLRIITEGINRRNRWTTLGFLVMDGE